MCGCALERHLPTALGGEGRRWTCPMHAEVIRDAPGACPICGMDLEPMMGGEEVEDKTMERRMWLGAALTLPLFLMAMTHLFPGARDWHWLHEPWARWLQLALATPVVFGCGWTLFERGLQSLFTTRWNMFTLIMLGVGAAYGFSVVALVAPGIFPESLRAEGPPPLYFEASAVIVVLVLAGQVMEGRARSRTSAAIQALLTLAPPSAVRVADDGDETVVPLEEVKKGDRLRVKPGAKMPVDGVVLEGRSTVDESMITGESVPVSKEAGDEVTAGTVNGHGSLLMQAEKVGEETLLARMVKMVAEAVSSPERRISFEVKGEAGTLPAEVATPMAVVLAELLQNTADHAFPLDSLPEGGCHVVIELAHEPGEFVVRVIDNGVGVPEGFTVDKATGLGLSIVRALVTSDLRGTIDLFDPPGRSRGTIVELRIPEDAVS